MYFPGLLMEQNHLVSVPNVWNIHSSTIPSWILLFLPPCLLEEYWHFICLQLGPSLSPCFQESWEQWGPPEVPARVLNLIFLESSSWHYLLFQPPWSRPSESSLTCSPLTLAESRWLGLVTHLRSTPFLPLSGPAHRNWVMLGLTSTS